MNASRVLRNDPLIMRLGSSLGGVKPPARVCARVPVSYAHAVCERENDREPVCGFNHTL